MDNYNVMRQIGKGAFSNVYLCRKDKKRINSSLLINSIGILENKDDYDELFIIKEINIDNLVRKYMNKSRFELLNKIKDKMSLSGTASVNITPYGNKCIFNKEIMKRLDSEEEYYYKRLKDMIDSEIEILKKVNHENIIKYFSSNINLSDGNQVYCIKMEYCDYGDLYTILKKQSKDKGLLSNFKLRNIFNGFEEDFIKNFLSDTINGMKYLHDLNIIHRDIKLQNVLVKNVNGNFLFKLSDFGFSCFDIDTELNESLNISDFDFSSSGLKKKYYKLCGTPYYMAPEIILNIEEFEQLSTPKKLTDLSNRKFLDDSKIVKFYDKKIDLWSYGICLYELIFNTLPFSGISDINDLKDFFSRSTTQIDLHKKIMNKNIIGQNMKNILKGLLTINPSFRISTQELYNIINSNLNDKDVIETEYNYDYLESDYNIITSNPGISQLSKNVIYEPVDLKNDSKNDSKKDFSVSWDKINKSSILIMDISVDKNFMKWLTKK